MPARIGPRQPRRVYIQKWREHRGLTQRQLAERLEVTDMTVSRWERSTRSLTLEVLDAIAEALSIDTVDLYRLPDTPSADALLRDESPEVQAQAIRLIQALKKHG